jgi:p-aminobenzoyl-glutamate transporter AbgT
MEAHKYIAGAIWICLVVTLFIGQASAFWTGGDNIKW